MFLGVSNFSLGVPTLPYTTGCLVSSWPFFINPIRELLPGVLFPRPRPGEFWRTPGAPPPQFKQPFKRHVEYVGHELSHKPYVAEVHNILLRNIEVKAYAVLLI